MYMYHYVTCITTYYRLFPTRDGSAMSYFAQPLQKHEIVVMSSYEEQAHYQYNGAVVYLMVTSLNNISSVQLHTEAPSEWWVFLLLLSSLSGNMW